MRNSILNKIRLGEEIPINQKKRKNELIKNYANPIANGRVKMPKIENQKVGFLSKEQAKDLLETLEKKKSL